MHKEEVLQVYLLRCDTQVVHAVNEYEIERIFHDIVYLKYQKTIGTSIFSNAFDDLSILP